MTVDELLRELDRRGITVVPTAAGRLHYTSPTAAAFTPDLRDALLAAKPEILAWLTGERKAAVARLPFRGPDPRPGRGKETPHPRRSGSRPPAGSFAAASPSPVEGPRRPPLTTPSPARQNRHPSSSPAPAPQTIVVPAPTPTPALSSVSRSPAARTTVIAVPAKSEAGTGRPTLDGRRIEDRQQRPPALTSHRRAWRSAARIPASSVSPVVAPAADPGARGQPASPAAERSKETSGWLAGGIVGVFLLYLLAHLPAAPQTKEPPTLAPDPFGYDHHGLRGPDMPGMLR